ncbi:TraI domain-containing protein [Polaromonas naphthalenivorans]|uniref:Uncharacterized domain-containing protein n=1 Tax=Polaromonas naphthalenivorans (strain CJ2) TaxID=365044 RepID=A1VVD3_POLNA|nr:TraI domain-containing protein [Polaromonas naphthalenivorans]ABM39611.1 hypothetical protein Pnap_4329 [Polaromonas naphthalenivorans CJ2]
MKFSAKHPKYLFSEMGHDYFAQLLTACVGGEPAFRSQYLPVAERLACTVQDLPLENSSFAYAGGALQFGLLAGLTALRLCDGVIFEPSASAQKRMLVEPQYRYAAWCATLAGVPLIVDHYALLTVNDKPWSFAFSPSSLWEACGTTGSYGIEWKPASKNPPTPSLGLILLSSFFYAGQFTDFDSSVLASMCQSVNPGLTQSSGESSLSKLVRVAQEKVKATEKLRISRVFVPGEAQVNTVASVMQALQTVPASTTTESAIVNTPKAKSISSNCENQKILQVVTLNVASEQRTNQININSLTDSKLKLENDQKLENKSVPGIPPKVTFWLRALISDEAMRLAFKFLPDQEMVDITGAQLRFGVVAKEMFELLHSSGFVHSKVGNLTVRLNKELTAVVQNEFKNLGVTHA